MHQLLMIMLLIPLVGVPMDNILLLEHLVCLKFVIKLDGLIPLAKLKVDLLKN